MLAAPAIGPSINPASTTTSGCRVIGTGVNGSGIATCDAAARMAAKPTTPIVVSRASRVDRTGVERVLMSWSREGRFRGERARSIGALHAQRHRVAAAQAERGEAGAGTAITHRIQ